MVKANKGIHLKFWLSAFCVRLAAAPKPEGRGLNPLRISDPSPFTCPLYQETGPPLVMQGFSENTPDSVDFPSFSSRLVSQQVAPFRSNNTGCKLRSTHFCLKSRSMCGGTDMLISKGKTTHPIGLQPKTSIWMMLHTPVQDPTWCRQSLCCH